MIDLDLFTTLVKVALTFGLLLVTLRLIGRFMGPQSGKVRHSGLPVEVVGRTSLGKAAQIVLVRLGQRAYALGVSAQGVQMLTEVDLDAGDDPAEPALTPSPPGLPARTQEPVIRPSWRDAIEALRERTVRR